MSAQTYDIKIQTITQSVINGAVVTHKHLSRRMASQYPISNILTAYDMANYLNATLPSYSLPDVTYVVVVHDERETIDIAK